MVNQVSGRLRFHLALCLLLIVPVTAAAQESSSSSRSMSSADVAAAQRFGESLSVAEWLGPLAPVALSPFFGITVLAGLSQFGGEWIAPDNPLLGAQSPLRQPIVFWVFLVLTVLTSLPRLTKVSKPIAQATDQVESWAGIITLLLMKFVLIGRMDSGAEEVVSAGVGAVTVETLLMAAAVINILVISAVRFFFEMLIWITPFPTIDAIFEFANKLVCAVLLAVYAWSPATAMVIDLVLLLICLLIFRWVWRRQVFWRSMAADTLWAALRRPSDKPDSLIVFPASVIGDIPTRARCELTFSEGTWTLKHRRFLRSALKATLTPGGARLVTGLFSSSLEANTGDGQTVSLKFSRWYNGFTAEIASDAGAEFQQASGSQTGQLKAEFG